jgi:hypothetical protein
MIDWDFVSEGMKSIHWIRTCNDLPEEFGDVAPSMTIGQVWDRTYQTADRSHRLLNNSVLMMAAYLYFVYPKESLKEIDLTNVSVEDFEIIEQDSEHDKEKLINRIRNSVAHANYEIENNEITFSDCRPWDKSDKIKFKIQSVDFGYFIEQFRLELYKQKFE